MKYKYNEINQIHSINDFCVIFKKGFTIRTFSTYLALSILKENLLCLDSLTVIPT